MEKIIKYKYCLIIIGLLTLLSGSLFFKNTDLRWQLINEKSVPDVELINYLLFDSKNVVSGSVTGFVVFDDKEKQPKGLRQYVELSASNSFDKYGNQLFYLTDIIKMDFLPPKYFEPVVLSIKNTSGDILTLSDNANNLYLINKKTKEVGMFDATRDVTRLITDGSDFRDFMVEFLK